MDKHCFAAQMDGVSLLSAPQASPAAKINTDPRSALSSVPRFTGLEIPAQEYPHINQEADFCYSIGIIDMQETE